MCENNKKKPNNKIWQPITILVLVLIVYGMLISTTLLFLFTSSWYGLLFGLTLHFGTVLATVVIVVAVKYFDIEYSAPKFCKNIVKISIVLAILALVVIGVIFFIIIIGFACS
ncbi:MAG: hypothetical protein FWE13_01765 [Firmicutes bacterium]|nr:hypothetical protein [Bacillota bacterium]